MYFRIFDIYVFYYTAKLMDNKKVFILFQDKAVAFKIFELGLKVLLKIITF